MLKFFLLIILVMGFVWRKNRRIFICICIYILDVLFYFVVNLVLWIIGIRNFMGYINLESDG